MAQRHSYGLPKSPEERTELGRILGLSFGFPAEKTGAWFDNVGLDNVRVIRRGARVLGGLLQLPMGQHFGGRRVAMVGIAGVGVTPDARGVGGATELMRCTMRELYRRGVPVSTLYPAVLPLYRRAGYEIAGGWYRWKMAVRDLPRAAPSLAVRAATAGDERAVRQLYAHVARRSACWLDRSAYIWERVRREQDGAQVHGHVLERRRSSRGDADIEGYVFYRQRRTGHGFHLEVSDMAAASPSAARDLLGFLAEHRSLGEDISWHGAPDDPFLMAMRDHGYQLELRRHWMLRIVDAAGALEARGYPAGLRARVGFELADDVISANRGGFVLAIDGGRGRVKRGGRAELTLDIGALASLYSGFTSAEALADAGRIDGKDGALARVSAVFAGRAPSLPDMF